jgi:subtilase family serine protease
LDPGTTGTGDQSEATLDVDRTISTANGAYTDLVVAANAYGGIYAAASYNVNTLLDPVMTISFGACESAAGSTNTLLWDSLFSAGAAEGISSFVSSGDSAAAGCATAGSSAPSVTPVASINYICSSSYVTCVGGTEFNDTASPSTYWASTNNSTTLGSALSYIPEGVWNEPLGSTANTYVILGGGGGFSQYIAKPTWQTGTGVPADGHRDVPDVSFSAAGHDGYFSCLAFAGGTCATGYFVAFSGTSASAPEMAGIAALVNTRAGVAQGNFNPLIYRLATSVPAVFHDATVTSSGVSGCTLLSASICNNSTPGPSGLTGGLAGYALGTGYDQATGWGSLDVNLFVAAAPGFNLTAATPSISFTSGATTGNTDTVTLTSYNTFAGAVSLTCSIAGTTAPFPPSCVVAPTSITLTAKSTGTAVVTIGSTVAQASLDPASRPRFPGRDLGAGGAVLAAMLLGFLPNRRRARRILASLTLALLLAIGLGSIGGCSSSSGNGSPTLRSSAGSYTVTVTATSGTLTANTTFTVTIN